MITDVFLDQKRVNVWEHSKTAPWESENKSELALTEKMKRSLDERHTYKSTQKIESF